MYKTIWKFDLETLDIQGVLMPKYAEILTVQRQQGNLCMWALVDPKEEKEPRFFEIFGTGHPIKPNTNVSMSYIDTYQERDGLLIFHLFERIKN